MVMLRNGFIVTRCPFNSYPFCLLQTGKGETQKKTHLLTTKLLLLSLLFHCCCCRGDRTTPDDSQNRVEPVKIDPILRRALLRALSNLEDTTDSDESDAENETDIPSYGDATEREFLGTEETNRYTTEQTSDVDQQPPTTTEVRFHSFVVDAARTDSNQNTNSEDYRNGITASSVIPLNGNGLNDFGDNKDHLGVANRNLISAIKHNQVLEDDEVEVTTTKPTRPPTTTRRYTIDPAESIAKYSTRPPTTTTQATTTTTTPKPPEHNADGENIEKVEKDGVQVYQAPLVAAFTVHQDAQGLPRSVVPIYKQQQFQQQQLLQQQLFPRAQQQQQPLFSTPPAPLAGSDLFQKHRRLEQQLYEVQQRHREQELYLKQQRYYQEQQLQQQRLLLLQQQQQQQQLFSQRQPVFPPSNIHRFQSGLTHVTFQPSLQLPSVQPVTNHLFPQQNQGFQQNLAVSPLQQQILPRDLQLPIREPVDFLSRTFGRTPQKDFGGKTNDFFKQDFQIQGQLPRPLADVDFNNVLAGQQLPPQRDFREFRSRNNQVQILPSVTPELNQNLVSGQQQQTQSNRVFRSQLDTGNFGFNNNYQQNRVFRSELPTGNFGFNNFQQQPQLPRYTPQDRYRELLYRSGFTQRPEDLNIVSKVLALNPGGETSNNFLFGQQTKIVPSIVKPPSSGDKAT